MKIGKTRPKPCAQCEERPAKKGRLLNLFCSVECAITCAAVNLRNHTTWCEPGWHWFVGSEGDYARSMSAIWNEQGLTRYERDARLASGLVFLEKLRTGEGEEK